MLSSQLLTRTETWSSRWWLLGCIPRQVGKIMLVSSERHMTHSAGCANPWSESNIVVVNQQKALHDMRSFEVMAELFSSTSRYWWGDDSIINTYAPIYCMMTAVTNFLASLDYCTQNGQLLWLLQKCFLSPGSDVWLNGAVYERARFFFMCYIDR